MMKNDKKIERLVNEIQAVTGTWLQQVRMMGNQNAWTDRGIEEIISLNKKLQELYIQNTEK